MKKTKLIATIIIAGMLVTGCGLTGGNAIIKIDNRTVTQKEFNQAIEQQLSSSPFAKMGGDMKNNKDSMLYLMTEKSVIEQLIIKNIFEEEIKKRGVKASEKEVNEAINKIVDKMGSKEQLNKVLKQNNVSIKNFKKDIENQVKLQKLARLSANTSVSDEEVKNFYNNNKELFVHKDQVRASHILIPISPFQIEQEILSTSKKQLTQEELKKQVDKKIEENKELAEKLANELKSNNKKFENYARKYSKDIVSAQRGGDLGYFEADKMVPEFSSAAFRTRPNSVVGPVETTYGLHIIKVTDRKLAGTDSFDKVKADIKERLQTQKELKVLDDILTAGKKKAKIVYVKKEYNPEVIEEKLQKQLKDLKDSVMINNSK